MAPRLQEACSHIWHAIDEIEQFTSGLTTEDMLRDNLRLRAIERCLQVITEAAKHVPAGARDLHPEIDWSAIVAMGNILRHEYFRINPDIVIRVVRHDLAPLKKAVQSLSHIVLPADPKQTSS